MNPKFFFSIDLRTPNVTFKPRKTGRLNEKAVAVYQNADKGFATESEEKVSANKSMRFSNDTDPSHRLSMRLDNRKGYSCVSSRSNGGHSYNKKVLPSPKERLEVGGD